MPAPTLKQIFICKTHCWNRYRQTSVHRGQEASFPGSWRGDHRMWEHCHQRMKACSGSGVWCDNRKSPGDRILGHSTHSGGEGQSGARTSSSLEHEPCRKKNPHPPICAHLPHALPTRPSTGRQLLQVHDDPEHVLFQIPSLRTVSSRI